MNKSLFTSLSIATLLTACGGSGDSGESATASTPSGMLDNNGTGGTTTTGYRWGSISGFVSPVPSIAVLTLKDSSGNTLRTGNIDEHGFFTLEGQFPAGKHTIEMQHQGFTEFDGSKSTSGIMSASFAYTEGGSQPANLTPFSALNSTSINNWIGFDAVRTVPADLSSTNYIGQPLNDDILHGMLVDAISVTSKNLGRADTQAFFELMKTDFDTDGVLDGKGAGGRQLSYNGHEIKGNTYRGFFAEGMLEVASSSQNKTAVTSSALEPKASELANANDGVISKEDGEIIVGQKEFEYTLNVSEGDKIFGNKTILLETNAGNNLESITLTVADNLSESATIIDGQGSMYFDSTSIEDGQHTLRFTVNVKNSDSITIDVLVNIFNETPYITLISSPSTGHGNYTIKAEVGGQLEGLTDVYFNSTLAICTDNICSASLYLYGGHNNILAKIQFSERSEVQVNLSVQVDTEAPVINQIYHEYVTGYKVPFYRPDNNALEMRYLNMTPYYPYFLSNGSVSLNFVTPTVANLMANKHTFFQGIITDNYTDYSEITIQAQLKMNGEFLEEFYNLVIDEDGVFVLPITTEYFGEALATSTVNDAFNIIIIATDAAGNSSKEEYGFHVKQPDYQVESSDYYPDDSVVHGNISYAPQGFYSDAVKVTLKSGADFSINALNPNNPKFDFSLSQFPSGMNEFTIVVETSYGHTYSRTFNLNVDNVGPTLITETLIEATSGKIALTGSLTDTGSGVRSLYINDVAVRLNDDRTTFSFPVTLSTGTQFFKIESIDYTGNSTIANVRVNYDTSRPSYTLLSPLEGDQKAWQILQSQSKLLDFGISHAVQLLRFNSMNTFNDIGESQSALTANNIPYIKFSASILSYNVKKAVNVTYSLFADDVELFAPQILSAVSGYDYLLPLTKEYMTEQFLSNENVLYRVHVSIEGNSKTREFEYHFNAHHQALTFTNPMDANSIFTGNQSEMAFTGEHVAGLTKSNLTINGTTYTAAEANTLMFSVDTLDLNEGVNTATLELYQRTGKIIQQDFLFKSDNQDPLLTVNAPAATKTSTFNVTGNASDLSSGVTMLSVNGQDIPFDLSGDFNAQVSFPNNVNAGMEQFTFVATDAIGHSTTSVSNVLLDPFVPELTQLSPSFGDQQVWMQVGGSSALKDLVFGEGNMISIYQGITDHSGLAATPSNLTNNKIPYLHFTATDKQPLGGFAHPTVNYSLKKNGVDLFGQKTLNAFTGYEYILPITTESFGADWFKGSDEDLYTLVISLTHNGDTTIINRSFKTHDVQTIITSNFTAANNSYAAADHNIKIYADDATGLTQAKLTIGSLEVYTPHLRDLIFSADLSSFADGVYDVRVELTDRKGLVIAKDMQLSVDTMAPTFTHDLPEISTDQTFEINGTVTDIASGVQSISIDGVNVNFNEVTGAYTHTVTFDPLAGNVYDLTNINYDSHHEFVVTDNKGNTETTVIMVIIDNMGVFPWAKSVSISGKVDSQCDGLEDQTANWNGGTNNGLWTIYADTKTLNGTSILDHQSLDQKKIGYFRFVNWSHVHDYYYMLNRLTDATYSYYVNNELIFENRTLEIAKTAGDKQVNEFRIALTEEYLGEGFYNTHYTDSHHIRVESSDYLGHTGHTDYYFRICNYVEKGRNHDD